jgi:aminopeptidase N
MTLHALRTEIGDAAFFRLMRTWFREQRGGWATVEEFIATAERVSGQQLDDLFETWLFTPEKPAGIETVSAARNTLVTRPAAKLGRMTRR